MRSTWVRLATVSTIALCASTGLAVAQQSMDKLIAAAKDEGQLTTIALPHDWCGYGDADRRLQGEVRPQGQRAQPRCRLGRRDRGDQGQQGQHRPAGARRDRRRPVLRPVRQGRRPAAALQGLDLGHDPRQRQGCRRLLVRRLLRRARVRGEHGHRQERRRRTGPICSKPEYKQLRSRSPAIRAPPTRRSRASMPPASPARAATPTKAGRGGPQVLRRAEQGRQLRAGDRQGRRSLAQGATPIIIRWDYNALADRDTLKGNPHGRRRGAEDRRRRRRLRAGDQRLRAASERRQAVDGVPLLRRGPARLARRATATRSASTTSSKTKQGPGRPAGQAAAGGGLRQGRVPDARAAGRGQGGRSPSSGTPSSAPT